MPGISGQLQRTASWVPAGLALLYILYWRRNHTSSEASKSEASPISSSNSIVRRNVAM